MPVYRFEGPDGKIHRAEASSPEEAQRGLEAMWTKQRSAKAPAPSMPVIGDAWDSLKESGSRIAANYRKQIDNPGDLLAAPAMLLEAAGAIPTALQAAAVRPASRAIANLPLQAYEPGTTRKLTNAEEAQALETGINTALMGAAPNRALPKFAPQFAAKPPPRPTNLPKSELAASRYVRSKLPAEGLVGSSRPVTAAEAAGKPAEIALGALARRPGETADALDGLVQERRLTRSARMLDDVADAAGVTPEAASGNIQAFVDAGRARAAPLYEEAYAAGPITSPQLDVLVNRPSMRSAMSRAARIAAEEGRDPTELGFKTVRRGAGSTARETATFDFPEGADGRFQVTGSKTVHDPQLADVSVQVENPTAQTWDYVKRGIDDVLNGYRDKTTGKLVLDEEGRAIVGTLKQMRSELINANPAYGRALEEAGDYLSAEQAFRDGGKMLFNGNFTERQFADKLGSMSPTELEAFRGGIANHFYNLAQNGKLDPKVLKTPRVRAKLAAALGDDAAARLIQGAEAEAGMLAFERKRAPDAGSPTQELKAAMDEQDGTSAVGDVLESVSQRGVKGTIAKGLSEAINDFVARSTTSGLNQEARDEAGRMLMMSPEELTAYLGELERRREAARFRLPPRAKVGALTEGLPPPPPRPARPRKR